MADKFDKAIEANQFFTLRIPGFTSPRSTAETDSWVFTSFDENDEILDTQKEGLVAQATEFNEIRTASFESDSQTVGEIGSNLTVTFQTLDELLSTDWLEIRIPKWNQESSYPFPIISYEQDALNCQGLVNTKQGNLDCFLIPGR